MLAVVVSPHRFTTALTSEASIVPGASYRRITPTACPGRVLGAASQVRSCFIQLSQLVLQLRVARPPPNCTCSFHCMQLSSIIGVIPSVNVILFVSEDAPRGGPCGTCGKAPASYGVWRP